jgi:hypothetical protein
MPRLMQGDHTGLGWMALGFSVFVFVVAVSLRSDSATTPSSRLALMVLWIVVGLVIIAMLLPSMAKSRGSTAGPATDAVEVLKHERVGTLDVSVVKARDGADSAKSLTAWLKATGCAVPPTAEPTLADYASRGWVFVAARLADAATNKRLEPTPLVMKFVSAVPVYPMKLTGVENGELGLELCVLASGTASAPGMRAARSSPLRADIDYTSDEVPLVHQGLKGLADASGLGKDGWITRLTGRLSSGQQAADMTIDVNPGRRSGEALYTPEGARRIGSQWGAGVAAAGLLVVAFAFGVSKPSFRRTAMWVTMSVGAGFIASATVAGALPQYSGAIKFGRRPESALHLLASSLMDAKSNTLKDVRELIADGRAAGIEPFASVPPEGDVPGGYVLKVGEDGDVWIDLFDRYGHGGYTYPVILRKR